MTILQAAETILIVDADAGQRSAQTDITYDGEGLEVRLAQTGGCQISINDLIVINRDLTPVIREEALVFFPDL